MPCVYNVYYTYNAIIYAFTLLRSRITKSVIFASVRCIIPFACYLPLNLTARVQLSFSLSAVSVANKTTAKVLLSILLLLFFTEIHRVLFRACERKSLVRWTHLETWLLLLCSPTNQLRNAYVCWARSLSPQTTTLRRRFAAPRAVLSIYVHVFIFYLMYSLN